MATPPRVLLVFGFPNSGSTVFGLLLHERLGMTFCGELGSYGRRVEADRRCGCGTPLSDCEFWGDIRLPADKRRLDPSLLADFYARVSAAAGGAVLVDTSKGVEHAVAVLGTPGIEAWAIYLVRDPRGSIYSRSQHRHRRLAAGRHPRPWVGRLDAYWVLRDSRYWTRTDRAARGLLASLPSERRTTVRYEDLIESPADALATVSRWFPHQGGIDRTMDAPHVIGSNVRVLLTQRGPLSLRPDTRWTTDLSPRKRRIVELLTRSGRRVHHYTRRT